MRTMLFAIFAILILGMVVNPALAQNTPTVEVILSQPTAQWRDIVTVNVYVRGGTNVGGIDIGIAVDEECLQILDRQIGEYFPTTASEGAFSAFSELNEHDTRLAAALIDRTKYVNGDGVFYQVQLEVICQQATAAVDILYAQISSYVDPNAEIIDVISYNLNAGTLTALNTTLTISTVNIAPVATADEYATAFQTTLVINAPGVLSNDIDIQENTLTAALVTGASHGLITLNHNGGFTYTPAADFIGTDTFTYTASYGLLVSNPVTVSISINPPTGGTLVSNLTVTGNTTSGIILPMLIFVLPDGSSAEWFNLVITDAGQTTLVNQWFKTGPYCIALLCHFPLTLDLFPQGLQNGNYEWYVITWSQRGGISEPSETDLFTISVASPEVPQNIRVETNTGDVIVSWDDDPVAARWHILIKNNPAGTIAYDAWYDRTKVVCTGIRCISLPENGALPNGNYTIHIQAWGAGGFNNQNNHNTFSAGVAFQLAFDAVGPLMGLYLTNTASGEPVFGWIPAKNSTWTMLWLGSEENGVYKSYYSGWQKTVDMICPNGRTGLCLTTLSDIYLPNGSFDWWMINWGPAGYYSGGAFDGWVKALDVEVNAAPPGLAVPELPSGTIPSDYFPFQWDHVVGITWYHLWLGNAPEILNGREVWTNTTTYYEVWLHAPDVCQDSICTITPDTLYLPDGNYRWYLETYNPGWTKPNWNVNQFGSFSVDRP